MKNLLKRICSGIIYIAIIVSAILLLDNSPVMFLLVFSLLYTPCVAAIAAIRRELGRTWAAALVVWQCVLAWIFAFLVYVIGGFFI